MFPGMDSYSEEQDCGVRSLKCCFPSVSIEFSQARVFLIISAVENVKTNYDTYMWNISSLKYSGPKVSDLRGFRYQDGSVGKGSCC